MSAKDRSVLELALLALEQHYAAQAAVPRAQTEELRRRGGRQPLVRPQLRVIGGGKQ